MNVHIINVASSSLLSNHSLNKSKLMLQCINEALLSADYNINDANYRFIPLALIQIYGQLHYYTSSEGVCGITNVFDLCRLRCNNQQESGTAVAFPPAVTHLRVYHQ